MDFTVAPGQRYVMHSPRVEVMLVCVLVKTKRHSQFLICLSPASGSWANRFARSVLDGLVIEAYGEEWVVPSGGRATNDLVGICCATVRCRTGKRRGCRTLISRRHSKADALRNSHSVFARHPHVVSSTQVLSDCRFNLAQSCLLRASSNDGPSVGLGVHPFTPS
jgi:hypothetical protein